MPAGIYVVHFIASRCCPAEISSNNRIVRIFQLLDQELVVERNRHGNKLPKCLSSLKTCLIPLHLLSGRRSKRALYAVVLNKALKMYDDEKSMEQNLAKKACLYIYIRDTILTGMAVLCVALSHKPDGGFLREDLDSGSAVNPRVRAASSFLGFMAS